MTSATQTSPQGATFDEAEVRRFGQMAAEWWDPNGKFRPLHQLGPQRLAFVRDAALGHFGLTGQGLRPLAGLGILDLGCGGGLICEPLARMGGRVTGIDPAEASIAAAKAHAQASALTIDYRAARAEDLAAAGETFDVVVCLEVVEHVPDVGAFLRLVTTLARPGGLVILATLNRTLKSYALAIVATEYILGWLPRGTHQWDRFVTPDELRRHMEAAGLVGVRMEGLVFDPLRDRWLRSATDLSVNYMAAAARSV